MTSKFQSPKPNPTPTPPSSVGDLSKLSPAEQLAIADASKPIEGPVVNASAVQFMVAGNDAMLIFMRPKPLVGPDGQISNLARSETTAIIHLSMATVKDLSLMLNDSLAKYEGLNGQIVTEFTKRLASEKK
jgi:hypothetical protein